MFTEDFLLLAFYLIGFNIEWYSNHFELIYSLFQRAS
jgi:hypothetical protein